jgi:hypothetical protein
VSLDERERDDLIRRYADGPKRLRNAYDKLPPAARAWRPSPGKWSAHEVVVHCADSETNAAMRIRYLLAEKNPTIMGYDQDIWAKTLDYQTHPVEAAFQAVDAARANTVPLLRHQPAAAWGRAGTHSEVGPYSAEKWLQTYADHLETHARQIERNLSAWREKEGA